MPVLNTVTVEAAVQAMDFIHPGDRLTVHGGPAGSAEVTVLFVTKERNDRRAIHAVARGGMQDYLTAFGFAAGRYSISPNWASDCDYDPTVSALAL